MKHPFVYLGLFAIVLIFIAAAITPKREDLTPTYNPSPSPTISTKQKEYIDMLTSKCYNEEEVEVTCKG